MHLVRDVMSHNILYVTREATVRAAVELMLSHQFQVVPVLHEGQVVGLLDALTLSLFDGSVFVAEALREPPLTVTADMPLPEAARLMRAHSWRQVPVLDGGRLVGILSERDILSTWGSVNDSLTGLPVQHQLRRWLSRNMASGREVAILFLDIDNFGPINKLHGHVAGDRVLQQLSELLGSLTDPAQDFLCRYGGDEFAVGTVRTPAAVRDLAVRIRDAVLQNRFEEPIPNAEISIGLSGGQRSQARAAAHISATIDDLLTQASTASTAAKQSAEHISAAHPPVLEPSDALPHSGPAELATFTTPPSLTRARRIVIEGYSVGRGSESMEVSVMLRRGQETFSGSASAGDGELLRTLTQTTAQCLRGVADNALDISVDETYEYATPQGLACVGVTVTVTRPGPSLERLVGAAPLGSDTYRSYINAVLDATNRRLETG